MYELENHDPLYEQVYGSSERVQKIKYLFAYVNDNALYNHWMSMSECGHLIALHYDVVLYYLVVHQCLTFLPLRSDLILATAQRKIVISFVNENHFVQVILMPGHLIPP